MMRLFSAAAVFVLAALPAAPAQGPTKADIAKAGKGGCVLVDAKPRYGSAFAVAAGGYFITNQHVAGEVGETVKLVLAAGEKEQKVVAAKVLRADDMLDLALLKADADTLPLPLGDDARLGELDDVVAFGFPFGVDLSKTPDYPTITVTAAAVSSLRRDKSRVLERIQIDGAINPGCSGGPVLDKRGEVVGVVVSGIRGSGLNMAIPVGHLKRFLERPQVTLTAPEVEPKAKFEKATYRAGVFSVPATDEPFDLELVVRSDGKERRFPMTRTKGGYEATAAAFELQPQAATVLAEVTFADGVLKGQAADAKFTVGGKGYELGDVTRVRFGKPAAVYSGGEVREGELAGLDRLTVRVGGQSLTLDLAAARELTVTPPATSRNAYRLTVVANRQGKEVSRTEVVKYLKGTEVGGIEALLKGKLVRPSEAVKPVTFGKVVSTAGDYIGQGKSYTFKADQLIPGASVTGELTLTCRLPKEGDQPFQSWFNLTIAPPRGQSLQAKEYPKAMRFPFMEKDFAGLDFHGDGRGSNTVTGKFAVWELDWDRRNVATPNVKALAVDFILYSEGNTKTPLVGSIRINSKYE